MKPVDDRLVVIPESIEEIPLRLAEAASWQVRGGGSKPALSGGVPGAAMMDLSRLTGIVEYSPEEFTVTVRAGTRVAELVKILAQNGQYLPFDPPLGTHGATLGGTVAAGLSGSGRYRYGGVRDFLLGVQFIDGNGELGRGGSKVVKNAAGFDLPKLLTGSLGGLGILVELTFKVFPLPEARATVCAPCRSLADALELARRASELRIDLAAVDILPDQEGYRIMVQIVGLQEALPQRLEKLAAGLGDCQVLEGETETSEWSAASEFTWVPEEWTLVKVPLTPRRIPAFEAALISLGAKRRYICAGQAAWVAFDGDARLLEALFRAQGLAGLVLFGSPGNDRLGDVSGQAFLQRIKRVMDPVSRFVEV